jgi:hypothetical protein
MRPRQKIQTWLRKKIKRCTQHYCKTRFLASTIHSYCMRSTTVMRIILRQISTRSNKGLLTTMSSHKATVKWEEIPYWADADYLMTLHHSTQNLLSSNSTAPRYLMVNLATASIPQIVSRREASFQTPRTTHLANLQTSFPKLHRIIRTCLLCQRIWTPWSVVARLSIIRSVASMRIKL